MPNTSTDNKPETKWLKSGRVDFAQAGKVDFDKRIIPGVIMCQVGEAKGHGVHLEQEFIESGIAYANKHHSKIGMKARFGHPSMSNETLGTEMGRFKNFKVVDDKMVADLHLFESANLSPTHPGMGDWILSMAEEDPAAIMCSIVFTPDHYYQYGESGEKIKVWEYDEDGNWVSANSKLKIYVALSELHFCDIVDQGAATDKLFSADFNQDKFSVIATEFLNEYPQVDQFIQQNPDKLLGFLQERYGFQATKNQSFAELFKKKIKELFSLDKGEETPEDTIKEQEEVTSMNFEKSLEVLGKENPTAEELAVVREEIEAFTGENEKFSKEELEAAVALKVADKQKELDEATGQISKLQEEVAALKKGPAENPAQEKKEGDDEFDDNSENEFETSFDREMRELKAQLQ